MSTYVLGKGVTCVVDLILSSEMDIKAQSSRFEKFIILNETNDPLVNLPSFSLGMNHHRMPAASNDLRILQCY